MRDHQGNVGFAGGEAAQKIACAPEGRGRQSQADKFQAWMPADGGGHRDWFVAVG